MTTISLILGCFILGFWIGSIPTSYQRKMRKQQDEFFKKLETVNDEEFNFIKRLFK
jgi:hypothetical protein